MTTQQPRHSEPSVNSELGNLLRGMLFGCQIRTENTQVIDGHPSLQPDNLVTAPDRAPVVVEAEYEALGSGEADAKSRLGLPVVNEIHSIEAAIALRYPDTVRFGEILRDSLNSARLTYAVFYDDEDQTRFPESGWLEGSVTDLADLIRLVSVPQKAVNAAADALEDGIDKAATILNQMAENRPNTSANIARLLGMADVTQTRRMASAILANALVFHERIAGMHDGVNNLELVCGPGVSIPKSATLAAWATILDINYWSIFAIARDILSQLPSGEASQVLHVLRNTAEEVGGTGVNNAHDLTGRIFQRLIADRKYLATFYTLPASAALLARLAVSKMEGIDWSDPDAIANLRIGDFACGTGALLSAVYDQIAARHERAGGDPSSIHTTMMEDVLYGCDVMPSAIHITGSTLSGAHPNVDFGQSRLYTLAYGRQADNTVKIGSLELLQSSTAQTLFNTSDPAMQTGSVGEQTAAQVIADIGDQTFDLVIMNPPFTRATNHEGAHADITNPAFAAFGASSSDQTAMGNRINQLGKGTCYHGNAGIASGFAALADSKLKPGGVVALVLPLSAASGSSWQGFRELLAEEYTDLDVLSIAANGKDMSFSSDTGMAECLVIARKLPSAETENAVRFASFGHRPAGFAESCVMAQTMLAGVDLYSINDEPLGGTQLTIGDDTVGEMVTAAVGLDAPSWSSVRLRDASLAQSAHALTRSNLWPPGIRPGLDLDVVPLKVVARVGLVHRDIIGPAPRGPFDKLPPSPTATYPALWNHDATQETRLVCEPDSQLQVRKGMEEKAASVWRTAGRSHLNLDYTFGSQGLGVAFTHRNTVGGRVWPNVNFDDRRFDFCFSLWGNATLGLLSWWWHSNRQQSSKASVTIRHAESLPVLDFRNLTEKQLGIAEAVFDDFRDRDLKPAYLADVDPNRALLDRRVLCDLLGFEEKIYKAVRLLSAKWCAEPSVHGGKARPKSARFVP